MDINFGQSLRNLRIIHRIGQVELADAIGVSKGIISLWEQNKREPTLSSLSALADYFKISIDDLVGRA
jgi:transcriptional regulator with XRE-family HTH domain